MIDKEGLINHLVELEREDIDSVYLNLIQTYYKMGADAVVYDPSCREILTVRDGLVSTLSPLSGLNSSFDTMISIFLELHQQNAKTAVEFRRYISKIRSNGSSQKRFYSILGMVLFACSKNIGSLNLALNSS